MKRTLSPAASVIPSRELGLAEISTFAEEATLTDSLGSSPADLSSMYDLRSVERPETATALSATSLERLVERVLSAAILEVCSLVSAVALATSSYERLLVRVVSAPDLATTSLERLLLRTWSALALFSASAVTALALSTNSVERLAA